MTGKPICRLGDSCTGHACFPPRPNIEASGNVYANGIGIHRQSDGWAIHCCPHHTACHDSILAMGSQTVYVNGLQAGRIGDPVVCGSAIAQGSPTVYCGG